MKYSELQEYDGEKTCCDNCEREFESGEVVTVEMNKNLVFCYSDCGGGCLIQYTFICGEVLLGDPRRFKGSQFTEPDVTMPNYPATPVNAKKQKEFDWLRKAFSWFDKT